MEGGRKLDACMWLTASLSVESIDSLAHYPSNGAASSGGSCPAQQGEEGPTTPSNRSLVQRIAPRDAVKQDHDEHRLAGRAHFGKMPKKPTDSSPSGKPPKWKNSPAMGQDGRRGRCSLSLSRHPVVDTVVQMSIGTCASLARASSDQRQGPALVTFRWEQDCQPVKPSFVARTMLCSVWALRNAHSIRSP